MRCLLPAPCVGLSLLNLGGGEFREWGGRGKRSTDSFVAPRIFPPPSSKFLLRPNFFIGRSSFDLLQVWSPLLSVLGICDHILPINLPCFIFLFCRFILLSLYSARFHCFLLWWWFHGHQWYSSRSNLCLFHLISTFGSDSYSLRSVLHIREDRIWNFPVLTAFFPDVYCFSVDSGYSCLVVWSIIFENVAYFPVCFVGFVAQSIPAFIAGLLSVPHLPSLSQDICHLCLRKLRLWSIQIYVSLGIWLICLANRCV